jgi:hypothetical protein
VRPLTRRPGGGPGGGSVRRGESRSDSDSESDSPVVARTGLTPGRGNLPRSPPAIPIPIPLPVPDSPGDGMGLWGSHPRFAEIRDTPPGPIPIPDLPGIRRGPGFIPWPGHHPHPRFAEIGDHDAPPSESPSPICRGRGWTRTVPDPDCHRGFRALSHALAMALSGHVPVALSLALSGSLGAPFLRGATLRVLSGLQPAGSAHQQSLGPAGPRSGTCRRRRGSLAPQWPRARCAGTPSWMVDMGIDTGPKCIAR